MNDLSIFQDYYRCTIELTQQKSFQRVMLPVDMTMGVFNPDTSVGMEDVFAIHITESMLNEVTQTCAESIKEKQLRERDPLLMEMYMKYKMMLELKR